MKGFILMGVLLSLTACDEQTSDRVQNQKQEELSKQSVTQVGLPSIVNFQEKRIYKMILELRDTEIKTTTYLVDMNGKLHKLCASIGYGVPYATQYTNPMRPLKTMETQMAGNVTIPQADPNGLFSPSSADGTWVMCLNKETQKMSPVFVEPRVIVSPFELNIN